MSRKALVLDANILIRAVLGQKVRHLIIEQAEHIDFFAPMACFDDARKYLPMLLAKRDIPADPAMAVLDLLAKMIKVIETEWLDAFETQARLRRQLARRAKETLTLWLGSLATESGLRFSRIILKNQRTRWGSRSADGVISLNTKLLFLPLKLVRYVLMHELCHTLERNHTSRFWTHLRQFELQTDLLHGRIRDAWKHVPLWAHPMQAGREEGWLTQC